MGIHGPIQHGRRPGCRCPVAESLAEGATQVRGRARERALVDEAQCNFAPHAEQHAAQEGHAESLQDKGTRASNRRTLADFGAKNLREERRSFDEELDAAALDRKRFDVLHLRQAITITQLERRLHWPSYLHHPDGPRRHGQEEGVSAGS